MKLENLLKELNETLTLTNSHFNQSNKLFKIKLEIEFGNNDYYKIIINNKFNKFFTSISINNKFIKRNNVFKNYSQLEEIIVDSLKILVNNTYYYEKEVSKVFNELDGINNELIQSINENLLLIENNVIYYKKKEFGRATC
jgi:hypothetical protein